MTWLKDLAFGQHWERIAQQLLPVGEEVVEMPSGKFPDWDFRTTARTYEVKADRRAAETGNFFVEFECSGRGSGVATTKADMWNLFLVRSEEDYELYEIEPAVLKRLCLESWQFTHGDR